jgi:hypothetical protein
MKKSARSHDTDPGPRLHTVNQYLEKNFPDFFAEARFHVGNDDYFLYARFGKYLASSSSTGASPATRSTEASPC